MIQSCKKTTADLSGTTEANYAAKFFHKPANISPEVDAVINLLFNENEKNGFVNRLPANAGLPVWGKLIKERPKTKPGITQRGIIADKTGNMLIPLSIDNKTLSAIIFSMINDGKYEFYCYTNEYAYQISFCDRYSIKQREKVMGLFMSISKYAFGLHDFRGIPIDLFTDLKGGIPEEGNKTKEIFLVPFKDTPGDILIADDVVGPVSFCGYHFSGRCSCPDNPNDEERLCQDWWKPCSYNVCSEWSCRTFWYLEADPENTGGGTGQAGSNGTSMGGNNGSGATVNP